MQFINKARRYLLCFIYLHEPIPSKDISAYLRVSKNLLLHHLDGLKAAKLIKQEEKNLEYIITNVGRRLLGVTGAKEFLDEKKI